jgi:hypothetical protein
MNENNLINHWQIGGGLDGSYQPKSKKVKWMGLDSYENFIKNQPANYTEDSITYDFNSHGFRTREFELNSHKKNVLFLGCSHTMGVGLRDTEVWTHHVTQIFDETEYNCYNLGIGGGGGDTVARLLTNSIDYIHPTVVFVLWPNPARFERYYQSESRTWIMPQVLPEQSRDIVDLYSDAQCHNLYCKNKLIVELLERQYNFDLVSLNDNDIHTVVQEKKHTPEQVTAARDCMHWSPRVHQDIADLMIQQYKEIVNNAS